MSYFERPNKYFKKVLNKYMGSLTGERSGTTSGKLSDIQMSSFYSEQERNTREISVVTEEWIEEEEESTQSNVQ